MARKYTKTVESAKVVKFDVVGVHYEGQLQEKKTVSMESGEEALLCTFIPDDADGNAMKGEVWGFWASELLADLRKHVQPGQFFRVTFTNERENPKKNQSPLKLYKVEVA